VPTIIAAIDDLMFQSRLEAQARTLGYDVTIAGSTDEALAALDAQAALLVLDLHGRAIDWHIIVAAAKERSVPVLAFGRHTEAALLREARDARCERVVPRSQFVEELPALLVELAGPSALSAERTNN
jgi:CheY-like chemotaxis protein